MNEITDFRPLISNVNTRILNVGSTVLKKEKAPDIYTVGSGQ
jgi:hypothetical protein